MTVTENVYTGSETILRKMPAIYRYTEIIPKMFLVTNGSRNWDHEDVVNREPIRRFAIAMNTNQAFLGSKRLNAVRFQKLDMN